MLDRGKKEKLRSLTVELLLEIRRAYLQTSQCNVLKHWTILEDRTRAAARMTASPEELMFAKSLSDISKPAFDAFCGALTASTFLPKRLVVASSSRPTNRTDDSERFRRVVSILQAKGFSTTDSATTLLKFAEPKAWSSIYRGFTIPDDVVKFTVDLPKLCPTRVRNRKSCNDDCEQILSRKPIMKCEVARIQFARLAQ